MGDSRTSLLLHPVRLRILQVMLGRQLRTAELAGLLSEVPTASLYRHVAALVDGGILEVVAERQVGGATERTLAVSLPSAHLGADDITELSAADHLDGVTAFLASLLQAADDYLDDPVVDPAGDGFGYRQVAVWADDAELAADVAALRRLLEAASARGPGPGRRRRILSTVLIPDPAAREDRSASDQSVGRSSADSQSPQ